MVTYLDRKRNRLNNHIENFLRDQDGVDAKILEQYVCTYIPIYVYIICLLIYDVFWKGALPPSQQSHSGPDWSFRRGPTFPFDRRECAERMPNIFCTNRENRRISFLGKFWLKISFSQLLRPQKFKNAYLHLNKISIWIIQFHKNVKIYLDWRQIWRVAGRESGSPELLESPRTSPEVPRTSPEVFRRLPRSSLTVESDSNSNPEVPRKFPNLPRKFPQTSPEVPRLPRRSAPFLPLSLGSLTPSPDSQKPSLIGISKIKFLKTS